MFRRRHPPKCRLHAILLNKGDRAGTSRWLTAPVNNVSSTDTAPVNNVSSTGTVPVTSLSIVTSFNRNNAVTFFTDFARVYDRFKFLCQGIYNVEDTGVTMVQNQKKIIPRKGTKLVEAVTTVDRGGTLVTMALAVSANDNSVTPFFFLRKIFKRQFLSNALQGSSGSANKYEWMAGQDFFRAL
ncbi:hypothetical protein AVEN_205744-1 [Araneus ventricosus]|uniref:DDE-1 domain-containing protein n=1 Tax=Araneus ventricosus TaxID=182803 RepID=A0A4Y2UZ57_ARAVE|nr:hypothetical protein AVEN_205744-1 [Araneus ventricosus]